MAWRFLASATLGRHRLAAGLSREGSHLGRRCFTWQAPACDCYALLGVSPSATDKQLKEAYLKKAKDAHPDVNGKGSSGSADRMVKLNLCYEALTQRRSEYDAAKGVGGPGGRAQAYSSTGSAGAAGREPWWKARDLHSEDFEAFAQEWEDLFFGRQRTTKVRQQSRARHERHHSPPHGSWQHWADEWSRSAEQEPGRVFTQSRRNTRRRRGMHAAAFQDTSSSDEEDAEEYFAGRRPSGRHPGYSSKDSDEQATGTASSSGSRAESGRGKREKVRGRSRKGGKEPPAELWLSVPRDGGGHGSKSPPKWDSLAGMYRLQEDQFNGRAAYAKDGRRSLFLFWSKEFGDWKLAERLEDDGVCVAFAEDPQGAKPPWVAWAPRWRLWDPAARRFVLRRLGVEGSMPADEEPSTDKESGQTEADSDDDEVPWSRPPFDHWPTADLIRWCELRTINLRGCFDREAILEKVITAANEACSGGGSGNWRGQGASATAPNDSDSDGEHAEQRRRRTGRRGPNHPGLHGVRMASRVKTDGSYTKPPSLDTRCSTYGNRVERFQAGEGEVLPWLYDSGDRSRLYSVFFDGEFAYSLVWKKGKYWGRPSGSNRSGNRREPKWESRAEW